MPKYDDDEFEQKDGEEWMEHTEEDPDSEDHEDMVLYDRSDVVRAMELDLAEKHLKTEIMDRAISLARSNWLWIFTPYDLKLQAIKDAFNLLSDLVCQSEESS